MKIAILNGHSESINTMFDAYIERLMTQLTAQNHVVEHLILRDMDIKYCTGCWGCWVKKPGQCVMPDDSHQVCKSIINCDFLLWASPIIMGFPSALLKKMMDKTIPLVHPYYAVAYGEAHHRVRYERYPRIGLLVETQSDTDSEDRANISDILSRTAINFKSRLEFVYTTDSPVADVAQAIGENSGAVVDFRHNLLPIPGWSKKKTSHLTVFNGSPRGSKGNTQVLLQQVINGFNSAGTNTTEMHCLAKLSELSNQVEAFANAEAVFLGFPLYTDAMPGMVKAFIEELSPLCGRKNNPPLGFLVQSGFPESTHSRHIERYLEKLAARFGSEYMGTIVKGGCEGVRIMPENMNRKLFEQLFTAGKTLAEIGHFDVDQLTELAKPESYPGYLVPLFKVLSKTPLLNFYWNGQLKQNGVYEERFAKPFFIESQ